MYNAYTFPEARRRGYNTLLVRARIADAFLRFGAALFTSVEAGNESAACAKLATGLRPWKELGLSEYAHRTRPVRRRCRPPGFVSDAGAAIRAGIAATGAVSAESPGTLFGPVGDSERSIEWQCSVTDTSSR